jgi:hypothetical protein
MEKSCLFLAVILLASAAPAPAAAPPPQDQQIFYRAPSSRGTEIRVAAMDGSKISALAKFSGSIVFDVGSIESGLIAVTSTAGLQLLTYTKTGNQFVKTGLQTLSNSGITGARALDLSPDGKRIAYRGGDGTKLMVYTIGESSPVEWDSGPFVWDVAWARDGASIVYMDHAVSGQLTRLYEVTLPHQRTEVLSKRYMDRVEVSRTQSDLLLLSYNSDDGLQTHVGTWRLPSGTSPGGWVSSSLAGRTVANRGVFSCDDSYLIYGSATKSGTQTWYTRSLPAALDELINKVGSNAEPQSWSSCPTAASEGDPFQFRVPQ